LRADGGEMSDEEWNSGWVRTLGMRLSGEALGMVDEAGQPRTDDTLLILLNAHHETVRFTLPTGAARVRWEILIDTHKPHVPPGRRVFRGGKALPIAARSLMVLRHAK
jgi:glycogen operon protein